MKDYFEKLRQAIDGTDTVKFSGCVTQIIGMTVESNGPMARLGDICKIFPGRGEAPILSEVVGFKENKLLLMPLGALTGIAAGDSVVATGIKFSIAMGEGMQGRVLDALGMPIDSKGPFDMQERYSIDRDPPGPLDRKRIKEILPLGVRAIDSLLTIGRGQRIGIFAGSGVGKSSLLGMIARSAAADVNVIVLVGERGREVLDFMEKDLREEGLKKSVVLVATSDQPALLRLKSAMVGTAIAEFFRDRGHNVLLMMDSLTRYAMAQREIGMAIGEPPVAHGYTPSVFAMLPRLLERTGNAKVGSITAIYTVLVEGDNINEPISDAVRGILDGHIVLTRELANNNHYPPIDILGSVSRLMPDIVAPEHYAMASRIKNLMSIYRETQDLINIGAYKAGTNPLVDEAIKSRNIINDMLKQKIDDQSTFEEALKSIKDIVGATK